LRRVGSERNCGGVRMSLCSGLGRQGWSESDAGGLLRGGTRQRSRDARWEPRRKHRQSTGAHGGQRRAEVMARIFAYIGHRNGIVDDSAMELFAAARKIDPAASPTALVTGWGASLDTICDA